MKSKIYNAILNASMIFFSASFLTAPVFAMNSTDNKPVLSDTKYIQQLIDKTAAGEECCIPEGNYTVSALSVRHPIKLDGGGKVTLRYFDKGDGSEVKEKPLEQSYILAVWSSGVVIDGFIFENTNTNSSTGIIHFNGDNLEIRNNTFYVDQNCAGIISRAQGNQCVVDSNVFTAESGMRTFPMIQFGENSGGAKIKNNILEGAFPDMLSNDFLSNFLVIESKGVVVADNEFLYSGPFYEEDLNGYEDSNELITREAFAEQTKTLIKDLNPWTRSMGDKYNPETSDGFNLALLGVIGAIQIAAGLAYLILRRRGRVN